MPQIQHEWELYTSPRQVPAGESILREGDPGDAMFIIRSGEVAITKDAPEGDPLVLGFRGPGDLIGEIALISDAPRTASMVAVKPTELMVISKDNFWNLLRADDGFRQIVMETLINHLLKADRSRLQAELWERDLEARFKRLSTEHERMAEIMQLRQETMRFIIHDLRNPLHLAMTALAMVEMEPDYKAESDSGRFVTMAQGGLQRMLNLVEAILDVSRMESGDVPLDLSPVNLDEMIDRCVMGSQPLAITARVELCAEHPVSALPNIPADANRIERVIMNLIDNAMRFTPPDGTVTVSAWAEEWYVWIAVDDTGHGIPADQRERVFDRFVQTEAGRTSTGFGLGLAFCRSAIQAHGGTIRAEEGASGKGTRIVFSLPVS
jgi:signal transduction histidine kinase